jgi:hypothetical protein
MKLARSRLAIASVHIARTDHPHMTKNDSIRVRKTARITAIALLFNINFVLKNLSCAYLGHRLLMELGSWLAAESTRTKAAGECVLYKGKWQYFLNE